MRRGLWIGLAMAVTVSCGGDDDGGPTDPDGVDGTLTATVSGAANYTSNGLVASYVNNQVVITSLQASVGSSRSVVLTLNGVTGAGTFSLTAPGNTGQYIESTGTTSASWLAAITQGSGSVTFTTANSGKLIGNFTFNAPALSGGATGTRTVTGNFNITPSNPN